MTDDMPITARLLLDKNERIRTLEDALRPFAHEAEAVWAARSQGDRPALLRFVWRPLALQVRDSP